MAALHKLYAYRFALSTSLIPQHSNARLYDPALARFMSADPVVQDVYDPHALNPYSYARDNPLLFTDPTGMCFLGCFWKPIFHSPIFKAVAAIAAAVTLNYEVIALETGTSFGVVAAASLNGTLVATTGVTAGELAVAAGISGAAAGAIQSGTWQGALIGAGSGVAFSGIGDLGLNIHTTAGLAESASLHGLVGGLASVAGGGNFGSGFLAAGFSGLAAPIVSTNDVALGTAESAGIGGVGSVLGGGKFENGAITGAFGYLYNSASHLSDRFKRFFDDQYAAAKAVADRYGVSVDALLGVSAQESGWGSHYVGDYNPFGDTPNGTDGTDYKSWGDAWNSWGEKWGPRVQGLGSHYDQILNNLELDNRSVYGPTIGGDYRGRYNTANQASWIRGIGGPGGTIQGVEKRLPIWLSGQK